MVFDFYEYPKSVGAGFACPNASTNTYVDVFGRADPAPTGVYSLFLISRDSQFRFQFFRKRILVH